MAKPIYHFIAEKLGGLRLKLQTARMDVRPEDFVRKNANAALLLGGFVSLILAMFLSSGEPDVLLKILKLVGFTILFFVPGVIITFFYLLKGLDMKIQKANKNISKEIVFATRFLIVELESGISLYNSLVNLGYNYEFIGRYTDEIVDQVRVGTPIEEAFNEAIETAPSNDMRRIFWQILNSVKTGADVAASLKSALEHIIKEQQIQIKEYSRKLNPLAMFYMMFAVIIPSLGMTMLMIMSTFMNLRLPLYMLLIIVVFLALIQYTFLAIIRSSRPAVDL